jgi:hypothetical protein
LHLCNEANYNFDNLKTIAVTRVNTIVQHS